jgi:hypothetical protein
VVTIPFQGIQVDPVSRISMEPTCPLPSNSIPGKARSFSHQRGPGRSSSSTSEPAGVRCASSAGPNDPKECHTDGLGGLPERCWIAGMRQVPVAWSTGRPQQLWRRRSSLVTPARRWLQAFQSRKRDLTAPVPTHHRSPAVPRRTPFRALRPFVPRRRRLCPDRGSDHSSRLASHDSCSPTSPTD